MNTEKHRLVKKLKKSVSHFLLSNKSIGLVRLLTQLGVQMSNELLLPVEKVQPKSISPPLTGRPAGIRLLQNRAQYDPGRMGAVYGRGYAVSRNLPQSAVS